MCLAILLWASKPLSEWETERETGEGRRDERKESCAFLSLCWGQIYSSCPGGGSCHAKEVCLVCTKRRHTKPTHKLSPAIVCTLPWMLLSLALFCYYRVLRHLTTLEIAMSASGNVPRNLEHLLQTTVLDMTPSVVERICEGPLMYSAILNVL